MPAYDPRLRLLLAQLVIDLGHTFHLLDHQIVVFRLAVQVSSAGPKPMKIGEIAHLTGFNKRTASRIIKRLIDEHYVIRNDDGTYVTDFEHNPELEARIAQRLNLITRAALRIAKIRGEILDGPIPHFTAKNLTPAHRLIYARTLLHLFHHGHGPVATRYDNLMVAFATVISTYGPHPLGRNKIAEITRLPTATVSRTLQRLCTHVEPDVGSPRVVRRGDHYFVHPQYSERSVLRYANVVMKLKSIVAAAQDLAHLESLIKDKMNL